MTTCADCKAALLSDSALAWIMYRWLPNSLRSYFREFLGDQPWLDRLGRKDFWLAVFLLPFAPVLFPWVFLEGCQEMLSLTHMEEYITAMGETLCQK